MDHLPAPSNPTAPLPEVPYLCEEEPYDDGDFLAYPARIGLPNLGSVDEAVILRAWESRNPFDDREVEEFLQTWLFFGMLHELLGKHGLYDVEDYVEVKEDGKKCLHTRNLMGRLRGWTESVQGWGEDEKATELKHLQTCLLLAREGNYFILADHHSKCTRAIVWSISTILETLASAIDLVFVGPTREVTVSTAWVEFCEDETQHMLRNGWCIHEVLAAQKEFSSNIAKFYLLRMRKVDLGLQHGGCEEDSCKRLQIDLETYRPRHVVAECECEWMGPSPREVAACLTGETFPVLRVTGDVLDDVKIEVVPYVEGMVYVALSHVWADGLGNPAANCLPRCQLLRVKKLVEDFRDKNVVHDVDESVKQAPEAPLVYPGPSREIFIWCDTICCPVQDFSNPLPSDELTALQSKAIARLRQVYQQASHALVLDRSLEAMDFHSIDRLEAAARVYTSRWIRRLWTFQEGGIAKRLLIHFRDAIVDHRTIWAAVHYDAADKPEAHNIQLRRHLITHCFNLRSWFAQKNASIDYRGPVWSLCWRRVSVATDEALCLAAAYDLDMDAVSARPKDERMQEVWRQLASTVRGISAFIIFAALPRLSSPGFRWAPSSVLQTVKRSRVLEPVFRDIEDESGRLAPEGFCVKYDGWRIRPSGPPGGFPHGMISTDETDTHYLRDNDEAWYSVWEHKELQAGRNVRLNELWDKDREETARRQWHIILDICPKGQETFGRRGLISTSIPREGEQTIHHSEMVVWAKRLAPQWEILWELVYKAINPLRAEPKISKISSLAATDGVSINDAWGRASKEIAPDLVRYTGSDVPTPLELQALCREMILQVNGVWTGLAADEEVLRALRGVGGGGEALGQIVKSVFMGRIAVVEEEREREWIVD
ncbi:hypothetical protein PRZ48_009343 [Zasmidium cellare]|uniref:Heterokaryon incompatibility domain-containing protein n=1 Tax=Zasmidium cellare TaxID=395010 RepID=A0ABR0ECN9_ZASCE|nr:hypothetical protein PRZ48_009343 [Zasmidium cellare]